MRLGLVILLATPLGDSKQVFYRQIFHANIVEHYHCDVVGPHPVPTTNKVNDNCGINSDSTFQDSFHYLDSLQEI